MTHPARGLPLAALHFLATPECGGYNGVNILSMRAPAGDLRLNDTNRRCVAERLMQSTSLRDPSATVGCDSRENTWPSVRAS